MLSLKVPYLQRRGPGEQILFPPVASYRILVLIIFRDDYLYYGINIFKGVKYHHYMTSHLGKQCVLLERDAILKVNYS